MFEEIDPIRSNALHGGLRMENLDVLQIVAQIFAFIGSQDTQRQTDQGPQVHDVITGPVMLAEFVNLGMAVVAAGNAVLGAGGLNLIVFESAEFKALFLEAGLQKTAAAPAAVVVGAVGLHVDKIFFAHHRLDHKPQVFGDGITIAFADDLAGILHRKLDFQVFVPVGVDLEFACADPLGIIFIDVFDFEVVLDAEFFQSGPD